MKTTGTLKNGSSCIRSEVFWALQNSETKILPNSTEHILEINKLHIFKTLFLVMDKVSY